MNRPTSMKAILVSGLLLGCAGPLTGATAFHPAYYVSSGGIPAPLPQCAHPLIVLAEDARANPGIAGVRYEEGRPQVQFPIALKGDLRPAIQQGVETALSRAGGPRGSGPALTLTARVTDLRLEERTFHNAEFSGVLGLEVSLSSPGAPQPCWKQTLTGRGENYGRAGNPTNYEETVNRALENAAYTLLSSGDFQGAVCGCPVR